MRKLLVYYQLVRTQVFCIHVFLGRVNLRKWAKQKDHFMRKIGKCIKFYSHLQTVTKYTYIFCAECALK